MSGRRFGKKIIGTVSYMGGIPALLEPFTNSLSQLIQYNNEYLVNPGEQILYNRATVSYHSAARTDLAHRMRGDWLLMLDTDQTFDPDILARMLNVMYNSPLDIQILTAIYQYKNPPYLPKIYKFTANLKNLKQIGKWDLPKEDGIPLIPVDSAGAGCLLIRREVFLKLQEAFPKEHPFDIIHPFSEDNSFFLRCKKLKIPVYCTPTIETHHIMFKDISMEEYSSEGLKLRKHYTR